MLLENLFNKQARSADIKLFYIKLSRCKILGRSFHAFYYVKEAHRKILQKV